MCVRRELFPLTATPDDPTHPYLLHAAWTPKLGHALVIVFHYDIYYRPGPRGNAVYRLTEDAVPGVVSNGVPDWVYEGKYTPPYHVQHALSSLVFFERNSTRAHVTLID